MHAPRTCHRCTAPLNDHATLGLCPRCLATDLLSDDYDTEFLGAADPESGPVVLRYFGDYEFLEALSSGGMGTVHRARQVSLNRIVAVKTLLPTHGRSPSLAKRFRVEAEAAARLQHPHIVPIYAFGEYGGEPYLSMKFIDGARPLVDQPGSLRDRVRHLVEVTRAVHHAHLHGVLHRDLKPSNVLVGAEGIAYLTDFGLAKFTASDAGLTQTQDTIGTPAYMAPEQAAGGTRDVTIAADIYGLGAILYELLTGRPPFVAPTAAAVLRSVLEEDPIPPNRLAMAASPAGSVDRDLETICLKCLQKDPRRRYPSAEALADDLDRWLAGRPIQARPLGVVPRTAKWVGRHPVVSASLAVTAAALLTIVIQSIRFGRQLAAEAERRRVELVRLNLGTATRLLDQHDAAAALPYETDALRLDQGDPENAAMHRLRLALTLHELPPLLHEFRHDASVNLARFSTDGNFVVSASDDGTARIWDLRGGRLATPLLRHPARVSSAVFSPDGTRVLTIAEDGKARLWNTSNGETASPPWPVRASFYKEPLSPAASFSPDGTEVLTVAPDGLHFHRVDPTRTDRPPLPLPRSASVGLFHPDGRRVLAAAKTGPLQLWAPGTDGAWTNAATYAAPTPLYAWFSRDGRRLVSVSADRAARVWDTESGNPVTPPLRHDSPLRLHQSGFNPDGRRILTVGFDNNVHVWDAQSGTLVNRSIRHDRGISLADFSPGGRSIVTTSFDGTVRVWDAESGEPTLPALHHRGYVFTAAFDAAGQRLVTGDQDGVVRVWRLEPPLARLRVHHGGPITVAGISPDGRRLLSAGHDGSVRVWDADTGASVGPPRTVPGAPTHAAFDANGMRIAVGTDRQHLHVWATETGAELTPPLALAGTPTSLRFSADGKWLVDTETASAPGQRGRGVVWDTRDFKPREIPNPNLENFVHAGLRSDSGLLAMSSASGVVRLWRLPGLEPVGNTIRLEGPAYRVQFSPNGRFLVTTVAKPGYEPDAALLWSVPDCRPLGLPLFHFDGVITATFSPDGQWVATGGEDALVRIWTSGMGMPAPALLHHATKVSFLEFAPDSRLILTGTVGGALRLWDRKTGEPLIRSIATPAPLVGLGFSPRRPDFFVGRADGSLELWELTPTRLSLEELDREIARFLPITDQSKRRPKSPP